MGRTIEVPSAFRKEKVYLPDSGLEQVNDQYIWPSVMYVYSRISFSPSSRQPAFTGLDLRTRSSTVLQSNPKNLVNTNICDSLQHVTASITENSETH
jgi:hypothetical protein